MSNFTPDGSNLGVNRLARYARDRETLFELDSGGMSRMIRARAQVDHAIEHGVPVYGLTTGLGSRVTETLDRQQLTNFSLQTLKGRAQAQGEPLPADIVRGAMLARLNTLMIGASGASPAVAQSLVACLNANLSPVVGRIGSIGAGDLCLGATMGLALTGEGKMYRAEGEIVPAQQALEDAGLKPLSVGPKDGLSLANNASFTASMAAFAVQHCIEYFNYLQMTSAITLEVMDANLSPLHEGVVALGQHEAHGRVARHLEQLLWRGELFDGERSRKIQDPLSLRNIVQVHGSLLSALEFARSSVNAELNSVSDNPVVLLDEDSIVSAGGYFSSEVAVALEAVCRALDLAVVTELARISKLCSSRFSGLPQYLAKPGADSNGFAPVLKIAESLVTRIRRALAPVDIWPSISADGVEDTMSNAYERASTLRDALGDCLALVSLELMMGVQAWDLKQETGNPPLYPVEVHHWVRDRVEPITSDRPIRNDLEILRLAMENRELPFLEISRG